MIHDRPSGRLRIRWRRWALGPLGLAAAKLLLLATVTLALELPAGIAVLGFGDSTRLDYSGVGFGVFHPLSSDFISRALGYLIPRRETVALPTQAGPAASPRQASARAGEVAAVAKAGVSVQHPFTNGRIGSAYIIPSVPFTARTDTSSATRQSDDPSSCAPLGGSAWYSFTAPRDQGLFANTFGTPYPTALGVFTGTPGNLQVVGCDTNPRGNSQVGFSAHSGTTYYFQVAGPVGGGNLVFSLDPIGVTSRLSLDGAGRQLSRASVDLALSADGRWVVFDGVIDNAEGSPQAGACAGTSCSALFLRDRLAGTSVLVAATRSAGATYVNTQTTGTPAACCVFGHASISGSGRYVAFDSDDSTLAPGATPREQNVYLFDSFTRRIEVESVNSAGQSARTSPVVAAGGDAILTNPGSYQPELSDDGRFIAFESSGANLGGSNDTNHLTETYVRDRTAGRTEEVSFGPTGQELDAFTAPLGGRAISADGRFIALQTTASNIDPTGRNCAPSAGCAAEVVIRDMVNRTSRIVSTAPGGHLANASCANGAISADGSHVAFVSAASNLGPEQANATNQVYEWDRRDGRLTRVSVSSAGVSQQDVSSTGPAVVPVAPAPTGAGRGNSNSVRYVSLSRDGRYAAFDSAAANLVPGDSNNAEDVFVHDLLAGSTVRASVSSAGAQGDGNSFQPTLTEDAASVAFLSDATDLVAGDTNGFTDAFVHDLR